MEFSFLTKLFEQDPGFTATLANPFNPAIATQTAAGDAYQLAWMNYAHFGMLAAFEAARLDLSYNDCVVRMNLNHASVHFPVDMPTAESFNRETLKQMVLDNVALVLDEMPGPYSATPERLPLGHMLLKTKLAPPPSSQYMPQEPQPYYPHQPPMGYGPPHCGYMPAGPSSDHPSYTDAFLPNRRRRGRGPRHVSPVRRPPKQRTGNRNGPGSGNANAAGKGKGKAPAEPPPISREGLDGCHALPAC